MQKSEEVDLVNPGFPGTPGTEQNSLLLVLIGER